MPYFQIAQPVRIDQDSSPDGAAALQQDGSRVIQACLSESYTRRIMLAVNVPAAAPIVLGLSAIDAAFLGTQLLQLAARADDNADAVEGGN